MPDFRVFQIARITGVSGSIRISGGTAISGIRREFRDFRLGFRSFVHRISEVVSPTARTI